MLPMDLDLVPAGSTGQKRFLVLKKGKNCLENGDWTKNTKESDTVFWDIWTESIRKQKPEKKIILSEFNAG